MIKQRDFNENILINKNGLNVFQQAYIPKEKRKIYIVFSAKTLNKEISLPVIYSRVYLFHFYLPPLKLRRQ